MCKLNHKNESDLNQIIINIQYQIDKNFNVLYQKQVYKLVYKYRQTNFIELRAEKILHL